MSEERQDPFGASARREYERLHARREVHARKQLGMFGVALAHVIDEPSSMTAWKRGAEREERVGRRLEDLLKGSGVLLLHDRRRPGSRSANIDHLAVGPGGITVSDTKNYRGKVCVDRVGGLFAPRREVLRVDGQDRTGLVKKIEQQIAAVERVVQHGADDRVDIAVLCASSRSRAFPYGAHYTAQTFWSMDRSL